MQRAPSVTTSTGSPGSPRHGGLPPTSHVAASRIIGSLWPRRFSERYPQEMTAGFRLWCTAQLGYPPTTAADKDKLPTDHDLVTVWTSLLRPLDAQGTTGVDLALRWSRLSAPVQRAALLRLRQARGVYLEVLRAGPAGPGYEGLGLVGARDLLSGRLYPRVLVPEKFSHTAKRWSRLYGVLMELGDGTCYPPAGLRGGTILRGLSAAEFLTRARAILKSVGEDPEQIDPADPGEGLRRTAGLAFVAMDHWIEEQPEPAPHKVYLTTLEGDRVLFVGAVLSAAPLEPEALEARFCACADLRPVRPGLWSLVDRERESPYGGPEILGDIDTHAAEAGILQVVVLSKERLRRVVARLGEVLPGGVELLSQEAQAPATQMGACVETPEEADVVLSVSSGLDHLSQEARAHQPEMFLRSVRYQLDHHLPALAGVPRELCHTAEGREAVERWLCTLEEGGMPQTLEGARFLDLDPLREELGLPTVGAQLARGEAGAAGPSRPPVPRAAAAPAPA